MYDIKIFQTQPKPLDVDFEDDDLFEELTIENFVHICFFTNKRETNINNLPEKTGTFGGFFGDVLVGYSIGSYLWTLQRKNINDEFITLAEQYLLDSLAPLIDDNILASATITVTKSLTYKDNIDIAAILYTEEKSLSLAYVFNYKTQTLKD